jgi:hypothetical protein
MITIWPSKCNIFDPGDGRKPAFLREAAIGAMQIGLAMAQSECLHCGYRYHAFSGHANSICLLPHV